MQACNCQRQHVRPSAWQRDAFSSTNQPNQIHDPATAAPEAGALNSPALVRFGEPSARPNGHHCLAVVMVAGPVAEERHQQLSNVVGVGRTKARQLVEVVTEVTGPGACSAGKDVGSATDFVSSFSHRAFTISGQHVGKVLTAARQNHHQHTLTMEKKHA